MSADLLVSGNSPFRIGFQVMLGPTLVSPARSSANVPAEQMTEHENFVAAGFRAHAAATVASFIRLILRARLVFHFV